MLNIFFFNVSSFPLASILLFISSLFIKEMSRLLMYSSASSCISIYLLEILPSVTVSQIPDFRYSYNCHTAFNEVLICSFCLSSYCISPSSDCSNISARSFFKFSLSSINCSEYACASLKFSPHLTYLHSLSA